MADELLHELVFGESQVVSYRLLSRKIKCHVNTAKEHLWQFYNSNKNDQMSASYVITGWKTVDDSVLNAGDVTMEGSTEEGPGSTAEGGSTGETSSSSPRQIQTACFVQDQSKLEDVKSQFDRVSSIQVYSVGPQSATGDSVALENDSLNVSKLDRGLPLNEIYSTIGVVRNTNVSNDLWSMKDEVRPDPASSGGSGSGAKPAEKQKLEALDKDKSKEKKPSATFFTSKAKDPKAEEKRKELEKLKKEEQETRRKEVEEKKKKEQEAKKAEQDKLKDLFPEDEDSDQEMMDVDEKLQAADEEKAKQEEEENAKVENDSEAVEKKEDSGDGQGDVEMENAPKYQEAQEAVESSSTVPKKRKKKVQRTVTKKTPDGFLETKTIDEWVTDDEAESKPVAGSKATKPKSEKMDKKPAGGGKKSGGGQKSLMSFFAKK